MANFVMSRARRLFSYSDLEGRNNNNMAMETTSIGIGDSPSPEHSKILHTYLDTLKSYILKQKFLGG